MLRFRNGARGNLGVSQVAAGRKNCIRFEVYGSRQAAWWDSEHPDQLHLGRRDVPNGVAFRNAAGFDEATPYTDYPPGHVEGFPDTFKMLFRSVYSAIDNPGKQTPLHATARDGHEEIRLCETILKSHQHRRWVSLPKPR